MAQVNSENSISVPVDPTRRRFLAVAAVASAVGSGTLAAAAAMDPSVPAAVTMPRPSTPDPVFGLIEAPQKGSCRPRGFARAAKPL
jgi:hypothetical protein